MRDCLLPGPRKQTIHPSSQELFYEWKVALSSDAPAKDITFELSHLEHDDRVSLQPSSAGTVSDALKHWHSGLPEPNRTKPDYFIRNVALPNLSPDSPPTAVIVRRPLEKPTVGPGFLIRFANPQSANCHINGPGAPSAAAEQHLRALAVKLAGNVYRMGGDVGVPLKPDPGDVWEEEIDVTVELRCEDENCKNMNTGELTARVGKTPYERATEGAREALESLKQDLQPILGQVQGPNADPDPSRDSQYIQYSGMPLQVSPEERQRLLDVLRAHGAQVQINAPIDSVTGAQ